MISLYTVGADCGMASVGEVRAPYASLAEAQIQAEHDLAQGKRVLRIVDDETSMVLWRPRTSETHADLR